jgi:hypothetical protein
MTTIERMNDEMILLTKMMNTLSINDKKRKRVCDTMTNICIEENVAKRRKTLQNGQIEYKGK